MIDHHLPITLSEIFPLETLAPLRIMGIRLLHDLPEEKNDRISWELCEELPDRLVIYDDQVFWIIAGYNRQVPTLNELRDAITNIQTEIEPKATLLWRIEVIEDQKIPAIALSKLAIQILHHHEFALREVPWNIDADDIDLLLKETQRKGHHDVNITLKFLVEQHPIQLRREPYFYPEVINFKAEVIPSISLTIDTSIYCLDSLAAMDEIIIDDAEDFFFEDSWDLTDEDFISQDNDDLLMDDLSIYEDLIGLPVIELERGNQGQILDIVGIVKDYRQELLKRNRTRFSQQIIRFLPDDEPIVAVKFGENFPTYYYPITALRYDLQAEGGDDLRIDYRRLLKSMKIDSLEYIELTKKYVNEVNEVLKPYNLKLNTALNSQQQPELFYSLDRPLEKTPIITANNRLLNYGELTDLTWADILYPEHNRAKTYKIILLTFGKITIASWLNNLQENLAKQGINLKIIDFKLIDIQTTNFTLDRQKIDRCIHTLIKQQPHLIIAFLPTNDRQDDFTAHGSLAQHLYNLANYYQTPCQIIYDNHLNYHDQLSLINHTTLGILAKLGYSPFFLAKASPIADYIIGSHFLTQQQKVNQLPAKILLENRIFNSQGKLLINHHILSKINHPLTIAQFLKSPLENLPINNKKIIIYQSVNFTEIQLNFYHDLRQQFNCKFIFVQCESDRHPHLFTLNQHHLGLPDSGSAICLSDQEAIVVINQSYLPLNFPNTYRLKIHPDSEPTSIKDIINITTKLNLLHYGLCHNTQLPLPIYDYTRSSYWQWQTNQSFSLPKSLNYWL